MMREYCVDILTQENAGIERTFEPVRIGVPIRQGRWFNEGGYLIFSPSGEAHSCQTLCLSRWPDDSIKWLLVDFQANSPANAELLWRLEENQSSTLPSDHIVIERGEKFWHINTGRCSFWLDPSELKPFAKVETSSGKNVLSACSFRLELGEHGNCLPLIEQCNIESEGPLHAIIAYHGCFEDTALKFSCRLHCYASKSTVKIEFKLHNPQAARHPGGLWDLGDCGSIFIRHMSFAFVPASGVVDSVVYSTKCGHKQITQAQQLKLYQESSGGEQWNSRNHRNHKGDIPLTFKGYKLTSDSQLAEEGDRATPIFWIGNDNSGLSVACPAFWQNFPKCLEFSGGKVEYSLYPECFPDTFELQGGEQKTHSFFVDFDSSTDGLNWGRTPLNVIPTSETFDLSEAFPDLPGSSDLVDQFISSEELLAKREMIDEYGWRNFGDVYADHEAVEYKGSDLLVSHYNNQYDFLAGAYKKAFSTSDFNWSKLASELAEHVLDIDIYHTDQDRDDYNHGLFWHTDHYVSAGLATHRSYSKEQNATYELHAGGGGPGSEHCYTSGLLMHYYQTGDPKFKQAVIDLAHWELIALFGSQTILASLKRFVGQLMQLRSVQGRRALLPYYPLTRGSGNTITACLDAFELTCDKKWLTAAEQVIRYCIHPADDIVARNLGDVEIAWSYTVVLAALGKYLDVKEMHQERDADFNLACQSLITYASWMAEHEYPYLNKPEILEFPNATWAAQELRKCVVFYYAAKYVDTHEKRDLFLQKARYFMTKQKGNC